LGKSLIKSLIDLSENPSKKEYLYSIKTFMENISDYESSNQNDSQEFGKDLINEIIIKIKNIEGINNYQKSESDIDSDIISISEKRNRYKNFIDKYQKDEIVLEKMFVVNECITVYDNKNMSNLIFNTSFDIELTFPLNINNEYLKQYSLKELLEFKFNTMLNNYIKVDKNNENRMKSNITKICKLPKILIISIVRAIKNKDLIQSLLTFPKILNLKDYVDKELISLHPGGKNDYNAKYKLFAINEKSGGFDFNGHYYCHINIVNEWFKFMDEIVKKSNLFFTSKKVVGLFYKKE
jgi:ubiquitin C-terminal hydrolase